MLKINIWAGKAVRLHTCETPSRGFEEKCEGCGAPNEPGQLLAFSRHAFVASCCRLRRALQYVGAQRLTGGRAGASRRHWAMQRFALPLNSCCGALKPSLKDLVLTLWRPEAGNAPHVCGSRLSRTRGESLVPLPGSPGRPGTLPGNPFVIYEGWGTPGPETS